MRNLALMRLHLYLVAAALPAVLPAQDVIEAAATAPISSAEVADLRATLPERPPIPQNRDAAAIASYREALAAWQEQATEHVRTAIVPALRDRTPRDATSALAAASLVGMADDDLALAFTRFGVEHAEGDLQLPERGDRSAEAQQAMALRNAVNKLIAGAETVSEARAALEHGARLFPGQPFITAAYRNYELISRLLGEAEPQQLDGLVDALAAAVPESERESFAKSARMIGSAAPELAIDHVVGAESAAALRESMAGKAVLLDFFAFWCGPCKATFPHLKELMAKHGEHFRIVGVTYLNGYFNESAMEVSVDERQQGEFMDPETELGWLAEFRDHYDLPWPFAVEGAYYRKGSEVVTNDRENFPAFGVRGIPHAALIDADGRLRYVKVGSGASPAFDAAIAAVVAEAAAR